MEKRYFNKDKKKAKGFSSPDYDVRYIISDDDKTITKKFYYSKDYLRLAYFMKNGLIKEVKSEYTETDNLVKYEKSLFIDGTTGILEYEYFNNTYGYIYKKKDIHGNIKITSRYLEETNDNILTCTGIFFNDDLSVKTILRDIKIYKDKEMKELLYKISDNISGDRIANKLSIDDVVSGKNYDYDCIK